jgi:ArsR family transcriptional regulator
MELYRIFRALADPNRLRILNLLLDEPLCVCQLESVLNLPQSLISRHLAYLRAAGMVRDRRQGTRVHYSVVRDRAVLERLASWLREVLLTEEIHRADLRQCEEMKGLCCPAAPSAAAAPVAALAKGAQ